MPTQFVSLINFYSVEIFTQNKIIGYVQCCKVLDTYRKAYIIFVVSPHVFIKE